MEPAEMGRLPASCLTRHRFTLFLRLLTENCLPNWLFSQTVVMRLSFVLRVLNHPLPSLDAIESPCTTTATSQGPGGQGKEPQESCSALVSAAQRHCSGPEKVQGTGSPSLRGDMALPSGNPGLMGDTALSAGNHQNYRNTAYSLAHSPNTQILSEHLLFVVLFPAPDWRHSTCSQGAHVLAGRTRCSPPPDPQPQPRLPVWSQNMVTAGCLAAEAAVFNRVQLDSHNRIQRVTRIRRSPTQSEF